MMLDYEHAPTFVSHVEIAPTCSRARHKVKSARLWWKYDKCAALSNWDSWYEISVFPLIHIFLLCYANMMHFPDIVHTLFPNLSISIFKISIALRVSECSQESNNQKTQKDMNDMCVFMIPATLHINWRCICLALHNIFFSKLYDVACIIWTQSHAW